MNSSTVAIHIYTLLKVGVSCMCTYISVAVVKVLIREILMTYCLNLSLTFDFLNFLLGRSCPISIYVHCIWSSHNGIYSYHEIFRIKLEVQYGFRSHHSCEAQLVLTTADLTIAIIINYTSRHGYSFNFSKAFDKVAHTGLVHKLQFYVYWILYCIG